MPCNEVQDDEEEAQRRELLGRGDISGPEPRPDSVNREELEDEWSSKGEQDENHERFPSRAALPHPLEEPLAFLKLRADAFLCAGVGKFGAAAFSLTTDLLDPVASPCRGRERIVS